jgi:hypothetical protein
MAGSASGYALRSAAHQPTSTHNPEENDSTELLGLDCAFAPVALEAALSRADMVDNV